MYTLIGKKSGMTRIFLDNGVSIPVTVIYLLENRIIQVKKDINKINSVQISFGYKKNNKINKSLLGIFKKKNIIPNKKIIEFKDYKNHYNESYINKIIDLNFLFNIKTINITGFSKGKGYSGVIKRWNFKSQDSTHGNSLSHRAPGSIGQNQSPGRVFKGKKMSGRYSNVKVTVKNLKIIKINLDEKLIIIKGCVPGQIGDDLIIKPNLNI